MNTIKKVCSILVDILIVLVFVLSIVIVIFNASFKADKGYSQLFGHTLFTVETDSMDPTIKVGDLIVGKLIDGKTEFVKDETIISFFDYDSVEQKTFINTHRLIDITENGTEKLYWTQGDNVFKTHKRGPFTVDASGNISDKNKTYSYDESKIQLVEENNYYMDNNGRAHLIEDLDAFFYFDELTGDMYYHKDNKFYFVNSESEKFIVDERARLIDKDGNYLMQPDEYPKTASGLIATYEFKLAGFGNVLNFLKQPLGFILCLMLPMLLVIGYQVYNLIAIYMSSKKEEMLEEAKDQTSDEVKDAIIKEYLAKQAKQNEENDNK